MNNPTWYVYYLLMLALAVLVLILAYRLSNRFPYKFLTTLLYYLLFIVFYTFLIYVVPDLLVLARGESISTRDTSTYWLCNFFAFPLVVIYLFFFSRFLFELVSKKIPFYLRCGFFISGIILLALYGYSLQVTLQTGNSIFSTFVYNYLIRQPSSIFRFACILYIASQTRTLAQIHWRRAVRVICGYYVIAFLIHIPLPFLAQSQAVFYGRPFYFIGLNLPVLIYLGHFLARHAQAEPLAADDSEKLNRLCTAYGISRREQEIFLLLLSGRSNQEIEQELYISLKTVKAHVYNVYQKFGVNSRLKLANLVRAKLQDSSQTPTA